MNDRVFIALVGAAIVIALAVVVLLDVAVFVGGH